MSPESDGETGETGQSPAGDWPVELRGVTESVVTTLGPNGLWNVAALGLRADDAAPATATTWGDTRTRRNFHRRGDGVVQFTRDPLLVVDAALAVREEEEPVLDAADAWVEVAAEQVDSGESGGTRWEEWELTPRDSGVERETVPTIDRGFAAVVEATVAASRLGVDEYDSAELRSRLAYFEEVAETCGADRERAAFERIRELTEW